MDTVIEDFYERVDEIEDYLQLIRSLFKLNDNIKEIRKISLTNDFIENHLSLLENDNLIKTTTASFFLLLYNLMESTTRQGIIAIYDELQRLEISFNELRPTLKDRILHDSQKKVGIDHLKSKVANCIEKEIINASLNSKKLFSGNVDREKIQSYANNFGFSCDTEFSLTGHGEKLRRIKDHRNDLAHGNISFKELGRDYSIEDLERHKEEVVYYLYSILQNIKFYLENKEYLGNKKDLKL